MAKYKVIVPRLNIRKSPIADFTDKSNIIGMVSLGVELDLTEVIEIPNPALGKWYKDSLNQYYWGGGLSAVSAQNPFLKTLPPIPEIAGHWWITDYGIDKIWEETRGGGVTIAVIDSGLDYNHSNIRNKANITYHNAVTNSTKKEDSTDEGYHGTRCAGIISAHGPDVYGVAPEADLLVIKATVGGSMTFPNLMAAIQIAINADVDIISISYSLMLDSEQLTDLKNITKKAEEKNILIVASSGNTGQITELSERYPAFLENCLSVGTNDKDNKLWRLTTLNKNLDILAPGAEMKLLKARTNETITDSGTSYSTAYISGLCALYISKHKRNPAIIQKMQNTAGYKNEIRQSLPSTIVIPELGIISPSELLT